MNKTILIFGSTGMLGSNVYDVLKDKYNLILTARDKKKIVLLDDKYGEVKKHKVVEFDMETLLQDFQNKKGLESLISFIDPLGKIDYVINSIGLVIAPSNHNPALAFFINGVFPNILSEIFGSKLIQITTDCVFNGKSGFPYDENSKKSPVDIYGLSKSLGEPQKSLVLRTSIIGRELEDFTGLLEWFLKQKGETICGFYNHIWNGISAKEFGVVCDKIISNPKKYPSSGIYHVFGEKISKYKMLLKFREKYQIDCKITKDKSTKLNRSLATIHKFNELLKIPSFDDMLTKI